MFSHSSSTREPSSKLPISFDVLLTSLLTYQSFMVTRLPADSMIPIEKLTGYLLVTRPRNDKSQFLAQAGFTLNNPLALEHALRDLIANGSAVADSVNDYGEFYLVEGDLRGPNGIRLAVVTIWIRLSADGSHRFVTLKPFRSRRAS